MRRLSGEKRNLGSALTGCGTAEFRQIGYPMRKNFKKPMEFPQIAATCCDAQNTVN
jgi:hypothetical protein